MGPAFDVTAAMADAPSASAAPGADRGGSSASAAPTRLPTGTVSVLLALLLTLFVVDGTRRRRPLALAR